MQKNGIEHTELYSINIAQFEREGLIINTIITTGDERAVYDMRTYTLSLCDW